jgi:DNA-directed RNA polymerase sigma subunit (sigma70/sigma32)
VRSRSSTGGGATSSRPTPTGGSARRSSGRSQTRRRRSAFPRTSARAGKELARAARTLAPALGREPSLEELAEATSLPLGHVRQALGCAEASVSLNQAVGPNGDSEFADFLADPAARDPVEEAERSLLRQAVQRRLERLPERERLIVGRRFGLQGEPQTLETVGREVGLTRERARQLEMQALKQLETELADLAPVQTAAAGAAQAREAERVPA